MDPLLNPFDYFTVPFGDWAEASLDRFVGFARPTLVAAKMPVQSFLEFVQQALLAMPPSLGIIGLVILGYLLSGWRLALTGVCLSDDDRPDGRLECRHDHAVHRDCRRRDLCHHRFAPWHSGRAQRPVLPSAEARSSTSCRRSRHSSIWCPWLCCSALATRRVSS